MSVGEALKLKIDRAVRQCWNDPGRPIADAAINAIGIPLPVLAWCAANPEAAKGLAEGELTAVPNRKLKHPRAGVELTAVLKLFEQSPLWTVAEIKRQVNGRYKAVHNAISYLHRRGAIQQISHGCYSVVSNPSDEVRGQR